MTLPGVTVLDCAFVLAVTGTAMVFPPGALIVAAAFFGLTAFLTDRRTPPVEKP